LRNITEVIHLFIYYLSPYYHIDTFHDRFSPGDRETSGYVRDYWRICPQLLVELGISGDSVTSSRYGFANAISSATANPLAGIDYEIDKSNTLRLAYQSYVLGRPASNSSITPAE